MDRLKEVLIQMISGIAGSFMGMGLAKVLGIL